MEKVQQVNGTRKQASTIILISDKINLKLKLIRRDKEGHFTLVRERLRRMHNYPKHICTKL